MALWGGRPSGVKTFALAHGILAINHNLVGIVNDPIQNGVGNGVFIDFLVPTGRSELRDENGGTGLMTGFDNLQQIARLRHRQRNQQPFIKNEQADLLVLRDDFFVGSVAPGDGQVGEQLRQADVFGGELISAGGDAERTTEKGFSSAGSPHEDDVMLFVNIAAGRQAQNLGLIEPAVRMVLDVLRAGGRKLERRFPDQPLKLFVLALGPLRVDENAKPLFKGQRTEGGALHLVSQGFGHGAESHVVQFGNRRFIEHDDQFLP